VNHISIQYYQSPFGELIMGSFDDRLCLCDWRFRKMRPAIDKRILSGLNASYEEGDTNIMRDAKQQLQEYFEGKREKFDIPLTLVGSPFQKSVWNELLKIPFGETNTYLGISKKLKNEKATRAIASANGANAISIIVPCHRIVGSSGQLVGYAGGLHVKKKLLHLENYESMPGQMRLFD